MKSIKLVFLFAILTVFISSANKDRNVTIGLQPGDEIPAFSLNDSASHQSFSLQDHKGKYLLINFWASYDAPSRITNIRMKQVLQQTDRQNIELVSISYDNYKEIFEESIKLDKMDQTIQLYDAEGLNSAIAKQFRLKNGFSNYLINPQGVIIAKELTPQQLKALTVSI